MMSPERGRPAYKLRLHVMPKGKANQHTHRIIRLVGARSFVYKCADPDCTFLLHHKQLYHLIGRAAICWGCGERFVLTESSLNNDMPMCDNCEMPGVDEIVKPIKSINT